MGGMSFKCPKCEKWFLGKNGLHNHLIDKHHEQKDFRLDGVAQLTVIVRSEPKKRYQQSDLVAPETSPT
jgi:hypothetical protein